MQDQAKSLHSRLALSVLFKFIRQWNTETLRNIIKSLLPPDITTLGDLAKVSRHHVHILAAEVGSFKTKVFSTEKHHSLDLVDVLLASCAVPYIFMNVKIGDKSYMDGQLNCNFSSIQLKGRYEERLEVSSSKPARRFVGWNCYETLWRHAIAVQSKKNQSCKQIMKTPELPGFMLWVSQSQMQRMFYQGALLAACECSIHREGFLLPSARMKCCGISAATIAHELPSTPEREILAKHMESFGITVLPAMFEKSKTIFCPCGDSLEWSN